MDNKELLRKIKRAVKVDGLTFREIMVLELRYGLEEYTHQTLSEVAKVFGVTRERIRQIQAKALEKLKHLDRGVDKGISKKVKLR